MVSRNSFRKLSFARLGVEYLERREMLSVGSLSAEAPVCVKVVNQPVKHLTILPGAANKVLAQYKMGAVGRNFTEFSGLTVTSVGNQYFSQNVIGLRLMADMDGIAKNGCESQIAYGQVDWQKGVADLNSYWYQPVMVQPGSSLKLQVVADFSSYLMGDRVALNLVEARFNTLDGQFVSGNSVKYTGVKPVLHKMKSNAVYFSQDWNSEVSTAYAGQKDITLFKSQAWSRTPTVLQKLDFVVSQGDLKNGTNYSLWVTKWDQGVNVTSCVQSGAKPVRDKVTFNLGNKGLLLDSVGCQLEVHCDGASTLAKDPTLSIAFGSGFKAKELGGKALKGVATNGGEGQFQVWTSQSPLFNFEYASAPGLYVSEIGVQQSWLALPGTQDITLDQFNVYANVDGMMINQVVIGAQQGHLLSCTNYTLWADMDGNGVVETQIANGVLSVVNIGGVYSFAEVFKPMFYAEVGFVTRMEVHADVTENPMTTTLQTSLATVAAVKDGDLVDNVFLTNRNQPFWTFEDGDLG